MGKEGFTLVELLIAIAIIAILTSMSIYALWKRSDTAIFMDSLEEARTIGGNNVRRSIVTLFNCRTGTQTFSSSDAKYFTNATYGTTGSGACSVVLTYGTGSGVPLSMRSKTMTLAYAFVGKAGLSEESCKTNVPSTNYSSTVCQYVGP